MEPALDVLNRALYGDPGARSFLERTSSIYVLDVTDPSNPKTYGCWNFIHQAMNEVERFEAAALNDRGAGAALLVNGAGLAHHVRLLSMMAVRVARRAPSTDKALIMTCISNAAQFDGTSQWLIDLNLELREIVMGRIAAMAFDFSFHRQVGTQVRSSAFADVVVMETFCAILSANAVASGPAAIRHFATEWIIPSSKHLPPCALAAVVLHMALEAVRKSAPAGTKDVLQQLSLQVVSLVVVPILADAVMENSSSADQAKAPHEASARISAMCLRAITAWCAATELSLPQIKHICNKCNINVVDVVNDAMYSDSPQVIESLAELVETLVLKAAENPVSPERMTQVRYILQVDEESFHARFSSDQLKTIELKEMESIVEELVSAIGLQRFRFTERQRSGDHDVCRNLVRIAASVCARCFNDPPDSFAVKPDPGVIELLFKAASHPSVNISAIALDALCQAGRKGYAGVDVLLPILQRRAIIPHHVTPSGSLSLSAYDLCGVTVHDFEIFRESVLTKALSLCWSSNAVDYMESCTAAVEEFCSVRPTAELTLQLEAALFCIEAMAREMQLPQNPAHSEQLKRCSAALSSKPPVLMLNPLTLSRLCCLLGQLARQFADDNASMNFAADLAVTSFLQGIRSVPDQVTQDIIRESGVSLAASASMALKQLCFASPKYFANATSMKTLGDTWEACCSSNPEILPVANRIAFWSGICCVLMTMSEDHREAAFEALASYTLTSLDNSVAEARRTDDPLRVASRLSNVADNISVLAALPRTLVNAESSANDLMQSGCDTSPDTHATIPESVLAIMRRGWPSIVHAAGSYSHDENVARSICGFLSKMLPPSLADESSQNLLREICSIAETMVKTGKDQLDFDYLFEFLGDFVAIYGEGIEQGAVAIARESIVPEEARALGCMLEELLISAIAGVRTKLGSAWTSSKEQGNGQPPFESKPVPVHKPDNLSNVSLAGVLALAKICMDSCPVFLFHFPSTPGLEAENHTFLRRAIDSAVVSLNDCDPSIAVNSMRFLKTVFSSSLSLRSQNHQEGNGVKDRSENDELCAFLSDSVTRTRSDAIHRLLLGCSGQMNRSLIGDAADLFTTILQGAPFEDSEADIVSALHRDFFLLGDPAKNTTVAVLGRSAERLVQSTDLAVFLEDMWELHQVEDTDALPSSDAVAQFLRKYNVVNT